MQNLLNQARNYKLNISEKEEIELIQDNETFTECYNCYLDSYGKSTGVYNTDTGTDPFDYGTTCPLCFGTGEISELNKKTIEGFSRNTSNEYIRNKLGVSANTLKVVWVKKTDIDTYFDKKKPITVKISDEEFTASQILPNAFYSDRYQISLTGTGGTE